MTPEQLDDIDRVLAEKVMGWTEKEFTEYGLTHLYDDWQPTRNIAQAWEVLETLSHYVSLIERFSNPANYWVCQIKIAEKWISGDGETAPLAICLACLKAKGINVTSCSLPA